MNEKKNSQKTGAKKAAVLGLMVALSMLLSYLEAILVLPVAVPGIKVGLSNLLIVILLYLYGPKEAAMVNLVRILLSSLLFGTAAGLIFSLAGGLLSFLVMALFHRLKVFTVTGVSILGGVFHNIGQLLAALVLFSSVTLGYYLPVLLIAGLVTGAVNGALAELFLKRQRELVQAE